MLGLKIQGTLSRLLPPECLCSREPCLWMPPSEQRALLHQVGSAASRRPSCRQHHGFSLLNNPPSAYMRWLQDQIQNITL